MNKEKNTAVQIAGFTTVMALSRAVLRVEALLDIGEAIDSVLTFQQISTTRHSISTATRFGPQHPDGY